MKKIYLLVVLFSLLFITSCSKNTKKALDQYSKDTDIVLTIYSYDGKSESEYMINSLGHAWLSIENNSSEAITINSYELKQNKALYFASWANSANIGICYNLEPHFRNKYDRYDGVVSLSVNIDLDDVKKISSYIENNDKWGFINNCSSFAINCWNEVVAEDIKLDTYLIYTPVKLCNNLKEFTEYQVNREMINYDEIFYYEDGIRQVLELC